MFDERFAPSESGEYPHEEAEMAPGSAAGNPEEEADLIQRINEIQKELEWRTTRLEEDEREAPGRKASFLALDGVASARQVDAELEMQRKQVQALKDELSHLNARMRPDLKESLKPTDLPYIRGAHRLPRNDEDRAA